MFVFNFRYKFFLGKFHAFLFFFFYLLTQSFLAQQCPSSGPVVNCDTDPLVSAMLIDAQHNKEFVFDSFGKYAGGMTLNGSTVLKLKVKQSPTPISTCQWKLVMRVETSSALNTNWETLKTYGSNSGMNNPPINQLLIRVNNYCNTPLNAGDWQNFYTVGGAITDEIVIVDPIGGPVAAGTCASECQTNGVGDYLQNYNEYAFNIDYRIVPAYEFDPGLYELVVRFCLYEK